MFFHRQFCLLTFLLLLVYIFSACNHNRNVHVLFKVRDHTKTALHFNNKLTPTDSFNVFHYMYFYNGAGVGAGDFNKDGLVDLFFAANQGDNKLYLNRGGLQFNDVTAAAQIPQENDWSTGVSVVDINNDGMLDIYICKVSQIENLKGENELLICMGIDKNGTPYYSDKAKEYGLDFSGFSTQAAFLDYDKDGDLDVYLLNHSVHENGTFAERKFLINTYHSLAGDRLYQNNGNHFTDVTSTTRINNSALGYGLGIAVADINLDGYSDLYIGNDFHENDYLYINQRNGTFSEELTHRIQHTSKFSMGVDIADINNDAFPEIISLDMLAEDPYILKRSLGDDEYNIFQMKLNYGYHPQYPRNTLQLNRGDGLFSEVGQYAGVHASDWSWAPLLMDFDNDGLKDLFISNGIPKRLNDIDYVNYISNNDIQNMIKTNRFGKKEMAIIDNFPEIKLPNKFFRNKGSVQFVDEDKAIEGSIPTFSNGAVYADLDNDGDLDIVVNNIDESALLYENRTNNGTQKNYLKLNLKGLTGNINAVGAKVIVFASGQVRTYEKNAARGFQSSMEVPLHIGLANTTVDSILLIWPDDSYQLIPQPYNQNQLSIAYKAGLPHFDYKRFTRLWSNQFKPVNDITKEVGLVHRHEENPFVEFDREPLLPFMVSREGPALAVGDVNGDGLEDVFIGSSKGKKSAVFLQQPTGIFQKLNVPDLEKDSTYEDVDACWADVNNDKRLDLIIASGGNEYYGKDEYLQPRVYVNSTNGFSKLEGAIPDVFATASSVVPYDFTGDGYVDLFIGARAVPWEYGQMPTSFLLENDRNGHFKNVTAAYNKELSSVGFVKHAIWTDLDKDGDHDLLLTLEWDGLCAFIYEQGRFLKKVITEKKGWWNFSLPVDVDGDGDLDLIAGNMGLNNRLKASPEEPVRLYYNDFDGNRKKEQILTYFLQGQEVPLANKLELEKQMPLLKKRFLYAEHFAQAALPDFFTPDKWNQATILTADYFTNAVLINDGKLNFTAVPLPWEAQLTTYRDAVAVNANNDALPDIILVGNFYENNLQMGRSDADFGTLLVNEGAGKFRYQSLKGVALKGQVRHIRKIKINQQEAFVLVKNNDSSMVVGFLAPAGGPINK